MNGRLNEYNIGGECWEYLNNFIPNACFLSIYSKIFFLVLFVTRVWPESCRKYSMLSKLVATALVRFGLGTHVSRV
jgi:hypothetical protein